jgi:hypothetical protein
MANGMPREKGLNIELPKYRMNQTKSKRFKDDFGSLLFDICSHLGVRRAVVFQIRFFEIRLCVFVLNPSEFSVPGRWT